MKPFANFSACFRRFIRRTPSARECAVIERLERQRKYCGRVRAVIDDPSGSLTPILIDYIRWHQQRLSQRNALIITPQKFRPKLRAAVYTPRALQYARGAARCIGQILILNPDTRKLSSLMPVIAPMLSGKDSILIICGDSTIAARFEANPLYQIIPSRIRRQEYLKLRLRQKIPNSRSGASAIIISIMSLTLNVPTPSTAKVA